MQGGAPYVFQDPHDPKKLVGFEVELADALAAKLGTTARFVQTDWSTLMQGLDRGTYAIAMNGLEATESRRDLAILSRPYYRFDLVLSVLKKRLTETPKTIGVLENSLAADWVLARPQYQVKLYQGVEEPYADVERGRIDAVLMDSVIEEVYGRAEAIAVKERSVASGTYVIACKKTNAALCTQVDAALGALIADGTHRRILERWKIWNDQQSTLGVLAAPTSAPGVAEHGSNRHSFTVRHFWLFVEASGMTLFVSLLAMALAMTWGLVLASARAFGPKWLRYPASAIVESFRGTPVLLQLYVIYFGLAPVLTLSPLSAAIITLGLNYGAYEAEIYRGGLNAVSPRQWDAGLVLGLTRTQTFSHVVMPQAIRIALPGMANDFVSLLKDSALVSVITVVELTKQMSITAVDVRSWIIPGAVCALLYMAMSLPASRLGRYLEQRLQTS
ncbi:MAG: ABC transporter permease subunit [Deltaproteobacteria bacterium]|nr:ABC transporter permease subunit [Deltaproteobacteria bacterium]